MLPFFKKKPGGPAKLDSDQASPPNSFPQIATSHRYSDRVPGWIFFSAAVLVVAILYWAQEVLIPIATAILLSFVLNPVVRWLERLRLGRVVSVAISVIMAFAIFLGIGWVVARQITALANDLPQYRRNIREKVADLRKLKKGGALEKVEQTVEEVKSELKKPETKDQEPPPREVVVAAQEDSRFWPIPLATGPLVERLAAAGLAIVLVIFMLIQREELRNRLIRILGYSRLTVTTKALEEAGERISRYLLAQLLINSGFGIAAGTLLFMIGVPYALLWGFMSALLRFIPYVGPWIAAFMPITLSLAYFPGWLMPLIVIGAYILLELTTNLLLEPLFYGESAGVSELAILIMAAFWTWLWGPLGLVLATPLTVCLVVFAKYVPEMTFITVLLSDAPAMEPYVNYYQRMLALDQDEAEEIVEDYLKSHDQAKLYDDIFVPALSRTKYDRRHGHLSEQDEKAIYQGTRTILEELKERQSAAKQPDDYQRSVTPPPERIVDLIAFPAEGEADEITLLALAALLDSPRCKMEVVSADILAAEMVALVEKKQPALIYIGVIAPGGLAHARYLCKRIRAQSSEVTILVGRWGLSGTVNNTRETLASAGADRIATTLLESRDHILSQVVQLSHAEETSPPARRAAN
jgi:predicted PurR-regulated permease PerM